ncbi:KAP family P-loop domain protein [Bacteriovorax sp. BSW11_IV]|uniref:KAP family P-loop NTPase fold protein n=1 Tax=Bacteriovorax sp. BSW11_IV TaxID=1353529 RepID=UPI000389F2A4|nr:KAP family P-loop domain protein [Bacteriovorax sp. BSW11_IV]EQC45183.1 KAP family P-loop domain protein [Bacteriovorax sp. BSW11_IV]
MSVRSIVSDEPIISEEKDLFKRSGFCEHVANLINNYNDNESIAIALCGAWGTGKTSILNMVSDKINHDKIIIMKFSPWDYEKGDSLYFEFLRELRMSLKNNKKILSDKILKKLTEALTILDPKRGKAVENQLSTSFSDLRKNIDDALADSGKKLLVLIDDLDRLEADEVLNVFKIVKSSLNFSNSIYMLSYDRSNISKAVERLTHESGESFLNKIIQLEINIPILTERNLRRVFNLLMDDDSYAYHFDYDQYAFAFTTVRDVKRAVNSFKFKSSFLGALLNQADLMAMTIIELNWPNVFKDIYRSKKILLGGQVNNADKVIDEILSSVEKDDTKAGLKKIIKRLFPDLGQKERYRLGSNHRVGRICTNDFFDLFFMEVVKQSLIAERFRQLEESLFSENKYELDLKDTNVSDEVSTVGALLRTKDGKEKYLAQLKLSKWVLSIHWSDDLFGKLREVDSFFSYGDRIFRYLIENDKTGIKSLFEELKTASIDFNYLYFLMNMTSNISRIQVSRQFALVVPSICSGLDKREETGLSRFEIMVLRQLFRERSEECIDEMIISICRNRIILVSAVSSTLSEHSKIDFIEKFILESKEFHDDYIGDDEITISEKLNQLMEHLS